MWVRGLKRFGRTVIVLRPQSHPMWVRGLKPQRLKRNKIILHVAPHVGAWIETICKARGNKSCKSHPMWVRGLKPKY